MGLQCIRFCNFLLFLIAVSETGMKNAEMQKLKEENQVLSMHFGKLIEGNLC